MKAEAIAHTFFKMTEKFYLEQDKSPQSIPLMFINSIFFSVFDLDMGTPCFKELNVISLPHPPNFFPPFPFLFSFLFNISFLYSFVPFLYVYTFT